MGGIVVGGANPTIKIEVCSIHVLTEIGEYDRGGASIDQGRPNTHISANRGDHKKKVNVYGCAVLFLQKAKLVDILMVVFMPVMCEKLRDMDKSMWY